MRRATITLDDELEVALDRYMGSLEAPPSLASLVRAALRRYLQQMMEGDRRRPSRSREIAEAGTSYDRAGDGIGLDPQTARLLRQAASEEGLEPEELARSVLREYLHARARPRPVGVGEYRSGRSDVGRRAEELLRRAARTSR